MEILSTLRAQWDRATAVAAIVLGLIVLLIGYFKISDTPYVAEQLPYIISAGLVGLFLLVIGATLWLSADLRDEWRKLNLLDAKLDRAFEQGLTISINSSAPATPESLEQAVAAGAASQPRSQPRRPQKSPTGTAAKRGNAGS